MTSYINTFGKAAAIDFGDPEDVLNQHDTISLSELDEFEHDEMTIAGIDELTPVDTFLDMQGDRTYVTTI